MNEITVFVAEQLNFQMSRIGNEFFQEDIRTAERGLRLSLCLLEGRCKSGSVFDDPHASATASFGGFQDDGIAELLGKLLSFFDALDGGRAFVDFGRFDQCFDGAFSRLCCRQTQ